ncbi:MAG: patatin family protein [Promethearchaeota archaeon]|nr:MAG: patatin family protein [Candidatus Lokiarchaeota archaeon]
MNEPIGLVLEGGGSRAVFTNGILDFFLEQNIEFPYIVGVSAGATNGLSYVSRQHGRNRRSQIEFIQKRRYLSVWNWLTTGNIFGWDYIFRELPYHQLPFDFSTFYANPTRFLMGVTDVETGTVQYYEKGDLSPLEVMDIATATCCLPFVSTIRHYNGLQLLDGGIADPIPVDQALEDGCGKLVIILTQPATYQKLPMGGAWYLRSRYRAYPQFIALMEDRHLRYNEDLVNIARLEAEGLAFVFRPYETLPIGRIEKKRGKLEQTYQLGYDQARDRLASLRTWLDTP